jgi:hypothetical protein
VLIITSSTAFGVPHSPDSLTLSTGDIVKMKRDAAIDALLDLHGSIIDQGSGYWVKLEAWKVDASLQIPHGIRYSLTLHEPHGKRIRVLLEVKKK